MREEVYPMRAMANLTCVWHRVIEKQMSDLGLSSIQSRMLGYLYFRSREGKKVFQKELEEEFKIRKSSVTSVIQILEKKGLVRRAGVPQDARKKELMPILKDKKKPYKIMRRLDRLEALVNEALDLEERKIWFSCICKIEKILEEAEYD